MSSSNSNLQKSPSKNGPVVKKRPVPTPRTILNTTTDDTLSQASSSVTTTTNPNVAIVGSKYTPIDQLILKYSQFVIDPNGPEESCHICHIHLDEPSPCNENDLNVICLTLCHHKFHLSCLKSLVENQPGGPNYIQCPGCHTVSGEKWGDMPNTGSMTYKIVPKGLPGFEDYHAIQITYNFQNGIQCSNHPLPGQPFYAIGFPKTAFLPDTEKGRRILGKAGVIFGKDACLHSNVHLFFIGYLELAFNRRLTFTISKDPSTGQADLVDWNPGLEHKTDFGPTESNSGYPDNDYLDRILGQLGILGILQQEHDV